MECHQGITYIDLVQHAINHEENHLRKHKVCGPVQLSLIAAGVLMAFPLSGGAQTATSGSATPPAAEAGAQKSDGDNPGDKQEVQTLERVTIRARGRDETQQSVPMSVKAFSAKAIEDAGFKKPGDFVAITPNLSMAESQSVGTSFMTIRGLSQVRNGEAPMAVVVDGVIQSDSKQFTQELFDVQSIEVLRGPQGALYGRNASGGAILIRTKQPTNETSGYVQGTVGTGNEKGVQGAINGALVKDKVFFRLAGNYTDRAGYFDNLTQGGKADPYRDSTLRGLLKWNATDDLVLDLRVNWVHDRAGGDNFQYQPTHLQADCTADPNNAFDFSRLDPNAVSRTFCMNNFGLNTRDMKEVTLKADYDLGFATATGTYSRNKIEEYVQGDQFPYTASRNLFGSFDGTQTQYVNVRSDSLEARLTSQSNQRLRWMAGVYGLKTKRFISTTTGSDLGSGIDHLTYDPHFDSSSNPTVSWFADKNRNQATAAFGNIDYDLTPKVEASFAVRYDRDEREQAIDPRQSNDGGSTAAGLPTGCAVGATEEACTKRATYRATQPKVSLRYKFDDGSLVYVTAGKGFRSGQFNQSGVGVAAAAATPPVSGVADQIGAEITKSFEVGYKTELANGKVRINTALFKTQVTNAPYFVFIGAVGAQVLVPLDKVDLLGGEFEVVASPLPGLDMYAGVGVTHSEIKSYAVNQANVGKWAPYVPNFTSNVGMQYRFPIGQGLRMVLRGDVITKGKQYWDPENSVARDAITLLNLRAGLEDAKGTWSASLAVNNAANKAYNGEWVAGGFTTPAVPRVVRADVRFNF